MKHRSGWAACLFVATMFLAGCNRPNTAAPENEQAAPAAPATAPVIAPKPQIPPATALVVNTVESLTVTRPQDEPSSIFIQATGTVLSAGWTDPKLVPLADANGDAGIKSFSLVATSPAGPTANAAIQPIDAQLRVDMLPADVKTIRVVSSTNEVAATISGP